MRLVRHLPAILWIGMLLVIFYFSSRAGSSEHSAEWLRAFLSWVAPHFAAQLTETQLALLNFLFRKTGHGTGYLLLTLVGYWALRVSFGHEHAPALRIAVIVSLLRAIVDEIHQSFVPGRTGTVMDVLIDGVGIALAAWFLRTQQSKVVRGSE